MAVFTLTTQVGPVPEQPPPLHPANVAPRFGVAVSVTTVPLAYALEQMEPQVMPDGVLTTVPGPDFTTVSV